jgi:hypothetical protein
MKRHRSNWTKRRLAQRLRYYPLLRLIVTSFWFRLAFIAFLGLILFLGLFLPRIWTVSADGFTPVVKISGLDFAQAWSLRRSAVKLAMAGRENESNHAWIAAIANNRAHSRNIRSFLQHVLSSKSPETRWTRAALGQGLWLLRLSETNSTDLDLVAQICDRFEQSPALLSLLQPRSQQLTAVQRKAWLKALFRAGFADDFAKQIRPADTAADPELALYEAAHRAGWNSGRTADEGLALLKSRRADPMTALLATHLELLVAARKSRPEDCHAALQDLIRSGADRLRDHLAYCDLLLATERSTEARDHLLSCSREPASARDLAGLANAFRRTGLIEQARLAFEKYSAEFGHSEEFWTAKGVLLIETADWDALHAMAIGLRQSPALRDTLAGFSYFLEGRAELGRNRRQSAAEAFRMCAKSPDPRADRTLVMAANLNELGFAEHARDLLVPREAELGENPAYWEALFVSGYQLKDAAQVFRTAKRGYELNPNRPETVNRWAAALVLNREQPELAIELTLQVLTYSPSSIAARVNHAFALLLNDRPAEAETLLKGISVATLGPVEASSYYLALFECHARQNEATLAQDAAERIDRATLFPIQVARLSKTGRGGPSSSP